MNDEQIPLRPRRVTIRHVATGLLVAAVALYVAARIYEPVHPLIGYLRAFAEAAMVGALADWFAVTALFRHPLGVPIPHTAVVQRQKDRVGDALGRFVERHFLTHEEIGARIAGVDFAALIARWLAEPGHRAEVARLVTPLVPRMLEAADDEAAGRFAQGRLRDYVMRRFEVAPLAAGVLEMLTAEGRHQGFVDALMKQAIALLDESEPEIRERVRARTSWLWRRLAVDKRVTHQIMTAAEETLADMGANPSHAWREGIDRAVAEFIDQLRTSDEYREQGERLKARLLDDPAVAGSLAGLWGEIVRAVREDCGEPQSRIRAAIDAGLGHVARSLADDPGLQAGLNVWLHALVLDVIEARRGEVGRLISDTVRSWDANTVAQRIEQAVGDDLQYIRINGTVIGGLAGVAIHAASQLVW